MVKITPSIRSQVIEKHLYSYSLSQIAKEVGISKTTAYNIVQDWNSRVSFLDLGDIRTFLSHLRKSGITIEQCVQGYRTIHILKQLGVDDDGSEGWVHKDEEIEDDERSGNQSPDIHYKESLIAFKIPKSTNLAQKSPKENKNSIDINQFSYFVEAVYKNCKDHKIKPSIIVRWINDLFNFYSIRDNESRDDTIYKDSNTHRKNTDIEEFRSSRLDENYDNKIPFISEVSNFITNKRKSIIYLEKKKNSITDDIAILEKQKMERKSELVKVIKKEKKAYSYFDWYNSISQHLFNRYGLLLEQEIDFFANALKDFKQYHFSATKILSEYKIIESLRNERKKIQDEVDENTLKRDNILSEIKSLEDRSNYYQQTIDIYRELHKEGLGLKVLKQLNFIVRESALENGLEVKDSIKRFLKDVQHQYDNKLGFENKINDLKSEMKKLEEQVPEYQFYLTLQGIVGPTLIHLHNCGVTNEDIIGMNHLVIEFKNSDFLSDPIDRSDYNTNTKTDDNTIRGQYWNLFVEKLKELKNVNTELKKQTSNLNSLETQISNRIIKMQQIDSIYADSVKNLNEIITKTYQIFEMAKNMSKSASKKILPVLILFPVLVDFDSLHDDDDPTKTQDNQ